MASKMFLQVRSPAEYVRCLRLDSIKDEGQAKEVIEGLVALRKYDRARDTCEEFAALFGFSSRKTWGQMIQTVEKARKSHNPEKEIVLLEEVKVEGEGL